MSIWLYRRELQGGDAYVYANDALREKVPLSMTVSCTLEQLHDTLASIIEDDHILFEIPFPLNTQMPYYNYLKQLFPNSYTQANVTQSIDGVNYYSGSWNLILSNEGYYHSWCQTKSQFSSGDLHNLCTVISHFAYNRVASSDHYFSFSIPVWGTQDIDHQHNKLQIRTSTAKNWLNAIYDVVKQTLTFDDWGPNIAGLISNGPNLINADLTELVDFRLTEDPYNPGGTTEPGGGTGDHDDTSDPIDFSDLPSLAASDTKFITLYNPTLSELNSLASWMWSPLCVIDDLRKLWNNPMQGILGLSIVPVQPIQAASPSTIYLGNLESNTTAHKITSQYNIKYCGSIAIEEYWGSYLDYAPYTKIEIYLPYIGTREINTDDVMGKTIECEYHIDVMSGACIAQIKCGNAVLYQFAGNCAASVPITGNDWTNVINGVMSVAISTAMVAVGGAVGGAASAAAAVSAVGSVAQNIASMKPTVMKSGSLAGGAGFLGGQTPYLIITRPRQALPENQNKYTGYPSWMTTSLADLDGMTYVAECHLEGIPCTTAEQDEIMNLLKGGVIL